MSAVKKPNPPSATKRDKPFPVRIMKPLTGLALAVVLGFVSFHLGAAEPGKARQPIYDEKADVQKDVAAAVARAAKENKRVLLVIGGNWCGWCYQLHDLFRDNQSVRDVLRGEYEVLNVDSQAGESVLRSRQITPKGYPYLAVLDAEGKLVTQQETGSLEVGSQHDPEKVVAFLEVWKAAPQNAEQVLAAALTRAAKEKKRVFMRFGAPWCGWCVRLDKLLAVPEVDAALQPDLVVIKIDVQRMTNGPEVAKKYQASGGIPWYAVLDADGNVRGTSDLPGGGNIGFPTEPPEVDHVVKILTDGRKRLTDEQVAVLRDAFTQGAATAREAIEKARAAAKERSF